MEGKERRERKEKDERRGREARRTLDYIVSCGCNNKEGK